MRKSSGNATDCPFCQIAREEVETTEVWRSADTVAFLDHRPLVEGHCLVIPTHHVATVLDLPDDRVGPLFILAKRVAQAMESALGAHGALILVNNKVSQSVAHLHVHVVPRRFKDGLYARPFFWARRKPLPADDRAILAGQLRSALSGKPPQ